MALEIRRSLFGQRCLVSRGRIQPLLAEYRMPSRTIEKIIAFVLAEVAVIYLALWMNVSSKTVMGLFLGVLATFLIGMATSGLQPLWQSSLYPVAIIFIGLKYGIKGAGAALLGYFVFTVLYTLALTLSNSVQRKLGIGPFGRASRP